MDASIKVVVVGDGAVGKTCLLVSYSQNSFPEDYVPTVFDNYNANVLWRDKTIQINLWDTAGQEDYDKLRPLSYPDTDIFIICFDVTNWVSFENVRDKWVKEVRNSCPKTPIILCGTKSDLRDSPEYMRSLEKKKLKVVTGDDARQLVLECDLVDYIECSARQQRGVKKLFERCIEAVLDPKSKKAKYKKMKRCSIM